MAKYLNETGLAYFWQQIKTKLAGKVDVEAGKGLSSNDYTTSEKEKLSAIADGANKTIIENSLTSDSTVNALSAAQGKALDTKIQGVQDSLGELGYGDMMQATYDSDGDGVVDDAAKLGGKAPAEYALADGTNLKTAFTAASSRVNIATGEAMPVVLGKVSKYFNDLKPVAFSGNYADLSNTPVIPTVTNDLTDALKANYDAAYTHAQAAHAPADAQANIIESITVNGSAVAPSGKAVNISVPTTVASLSDAGNYALKADMANVYKYKGSVATYAELPTADLTAGDVYNVEGDKGMNYAWTGSAWDTLGEVFSIDVITHAEIDTILAA